MTGYVTHARGATVTVVSERNPGSLYSDQKSHRIAELPANKKIFQLRAIS